MRILKQTVVQFRRHLGYVGFVLYYQWDDIFDPGSRLEYGINLKRYSALYLRLYTLVSVSEPQPLALISAS